MKIPINVKNTMLSLTNIGNYSLRRYEFRGYSVLYAWISQVELKKFVVSFLIFEKYEKDTEGYIKTILLASHDSYSCIVLERTN